MGQCELCFRVIVSARWYILRISGSMSAKFTGLSGFGGFPPVYPNLDRTWTVNASILFCLMRVSLTLGQACRLRPGKATRNNTASNCLLQSVVAMS